MEKTYSSNKKKNNQFHDDDNNLIINACKKRKKENISVTTFGNSNINISSIQNTMDVDLVPYKVFIFLYTWRWVIGFNK